MNFTDKLAKLTSDEMGGALSPDPEKVAEVIEGMAAVLGRLIAMHLHGDDAAINTMLEGTTQHVFTMATDMTKTLKGIDALVKGAKKQVDRSSTSS